jgi:rhodanese-related sulfurtransferase
MSGWARELGRAAAILVASSAMGLAFNALSARPVPLLARDGPGAWPDRAPRISAKDLRAAWETNRGVLLLDVRSEEAFRSGHSPRALHAPGPQFIRHYNRLGLATVLRAAEEIVVVCEGDDCSAGDRTAKVLKELGHGPVRVLEGGWSAARGAGLEEVRP